MNKDPIKILTPQLSYALPNGTTVKVSSEFVEHVEATEPFSAVHKIKVARRSDGSLLVLSVGTDDKLYLLFDDKVHDISPKGKVVVTFDSFQAASGESLSVVAATQPSGSKSSAPTDVYMATIDTKSLKSEINWTLRPSKQTPAKVTTLYLTAEDCIAGVEGAAGEYSSTYSIPLTGGDAWKLNPIPEDSDRILQVIPGTVNGLGSGIFVLYHLRNEDQGIAFLSKDGGPTSTYSMSDRVSYDMASVDRDSAFSSDLYVATNKGLAYFAPGKAAPEYLLPTVDCRQVVAHSSGNITTILVVSSSDDLYYIRRNDLQDNKYEFVSSDLPIRRGVKVLGVQSNIEADVSDVVLLSSAGTLVHFWKDLKTTLWTERPINFSSPHKTQRYPAYLSTCTVIDAQKNSESGRKVMVSTEQAAYVMINDTPAYLSKDPKPFYLDESGRLAIVFRTLENLGSVKYRVDVDDHHVDVDAAQRVITKLSFIKDVSHLKDAKSLKGDLIFKGTKEEDLKAGAETLSTFSSAVHVLDPKMANEYKIPPPPPEPKHESHSSSWWDKVTDIWHDIGDALQHFKDYVVKGIQIVIKAAVDVVNIFAKVLGKVIKFAIKAVGEVLRFVGTALHDIFGLDTSGFLHWVGFIFDWDKYKITAKHLTDGFEKGCQVIKHTFDGAGPNVDAFFEDLRKNLKNVIHDYRAPNDSANGSTASGEANKNKDEKQSSLSWVSDNSVVQSVTKYIPTTNVLKIIKKALGDEIDIPGVEKFAAIFSDDIANAISKEYDNVFSLAKDVFNKLKDLLASKTDIGETAKEIMSDVFWTLFDAIKIATVATMNIIGKIVDAGSVFINGRMKIPFFTALWEELTETNFTIANIVAIPIAVFLNIYTITRYDKLPFDIWTPPKDLLPDPASMSFPKWKLSGGEGTIATTAPNERALQHAKVVSLWLSSLRSWAGLALTVVEVLQTVTGEAEAGSETEKLSLKDISEGKIDKGKITETIKDIGEVPSKQDLKDDFVKNLRRGIFAVYTVLQAGSVAVMIYEKANDPDFVKHPTPSAIAPFAGSVIGLFLSSLGFCIDEKLDEKGSKLKGFSILRPLSALLTEPVVIGFQYSYATQKSGGATDLDKLRLTSGILEVTNAACDVAAIAAAKIKNPEAAIIPLAISLPIDIANSAIAIGASLG